MKPTQILAALATTLPLLATFQSTPQEGPPGMVLIKGDRFNIGADVDEIKALIEETQFRALACEVPKHQVKLDDFYIMPTEVTNEQFARYVRATGSQPPQSWGIDAIGTAGLAYATETGKARDDAKKAGLPAPKPEPFDPPTWWEKNWQTSTWMVPKGLDAQPVVYINYEQAEGYARWAGLRLMSEEEFQAAGRGKLDRKYAWGDDPEPSKTNCIDTHIGGPANVGSYPTGATWIGADGRTVDERTERNAKDVKGVFDLSGNVWEWTRSPFKEYPGFKPVEVKLTSSKKKEKLTPEFDGDHRTAVSGAFNSPILTTRLTTRRNTARTQATSGLGMRCTASAVPGLDIAESVLRMDLPTSKRPDDTLYVADKITAVDRWVASEGSAKVPGYAVIESYDFLAFLPVEEVDANNTLSLKNNSQKAPVEIGAFCTTVPLIEPALAPGTYTLSWRASGKFLNEGVDKEENEKSAVARQDDGTPALPEPEFPFDPMRDTLIFRNTDGVIVTWTQVGVPQENRLAPGRVALTQLAGKEAERAGKLPGTVLNFKVFTPMNKPNKGFEFSIPLTVASGAVDDTWRK